MTDQGKPSFRDRHREFIRKHGFSFKAYLIALAVLPPAAILIALKMDHLAMPLRIFAALFVVALHTTILLGGAALLVDFFTQEQTAR